VALGDFLDSRGKEQVDSACVVGILGTFREYQRCRLESAAFEDEEEKTKREIAFYQRGFCPGAFDGSGKFDARSCSCARSSTNNIISIYSHDVPDGIFKYANFSEFA
jgi:hypothetical protein